MADWHPKCEILKAIQKLRPMSRKLCLACKGGRMLCGRPSCPLLARIYIQNPIEKRLKEDMFGPSPSIFVGWKGYPKVFVGPMTSIDEELEMLDDPRKWYGLDFGEIIKMRSVLVRSKANKWIKERTGLVEKCRELALSIKPVDTEVKFKSKPKYGISFSPISQPMGPSGLVKDFELAENPSIPKKVDRFVSDELKAREAIFELYKTGFDVYYLTRVLSSGALGIDENRRLVPTRWSITAVDDMLGKKLMQEIRKFPPICEYRVYSNTYLDNHFEVLLMPTKWEYEQFEAWAPNTLWTMAYSKFVINQEMETYRGRTEYAKKEGGGYYAARFAVQEALARMRRQAGALVFREIYDGYIMPVGVWEVRENVRRAMQGRAKKFESLQEALDDISTRLKIPISEYAKRSNILMQKRLEEFS